MSKKIKINDEQIDINTFVTWFNQALENLEIDDEEIPQEQAEKIAEKFFDLLNLVMS